MRRALWASVAAALFAGCGGSGLSPLPPRASLLDPGSQSAGFKSPARWRYHPKKESALLARVEIGKDVELFAGERGERWLVDRKKKKVEAAARLAPEELIAILRSDDGGWLFVGASGAGYEAKQPLGPFLRASQPLDRLARVSAAGSTILGVTKQGVLTRSSDSGGSWQAVGPKDMRFIDVALDEKGRGLALATPERLLATTDEGASWKPLEGASVGALSLVEDGKTAIVVETALGTMRWKPGGSPALERGARAARRSKYRLALAPQRGPDAGALAAGRAIVLGDEYLEIGPSESSSSIMQLWRGRVHGALRAKPLDAAKGCKSVRLAGFDRWLYFTCASQTTTSTTQSVEIHRSSDRGKTWKVEPYQLEAKLGELDLAVGAGGQLLVTGVCTEATKGRGCSPFGVHYRRIAKDDDKDKNKKKKTKNEKEKKKDETVAKKKDGKKARWELGLAAAPSLKGSADELAFSPDGKTAFVVGRRTKNNAFAVFVSRDGGKRFEAREIDQIPPAPEYESTDDHWGYYYGRRPPSTGGKVIAARAADDGTFGIVFEKNGSPVVVVTDDEGRILSLANPPSEVNTIGLAGSRGLALAPKTRQAWETLDGGATWDPIGRIPLELCPGEAQCQPAIACHAWGCVVGHELSRIGWRGQADDDQGAMTATEKPLADMFDRRIRAPLSCTLEEGAWRALDGIVQAPNAKQAAIGKVAWFAAVQDDDHAAASVLHAVGGARPRVDTVSLLAAAQRPETQAIFVSTQVEGVAAMRYPTPETTGGATLKNVELAWDNLVEGKVVRARLPDAGVYRPGDYTRSGGRAQVARPALMSIGEGGLYLRAHYADRDQQTTYFVDGQSVQTVPGVSWPEASTKNTRTEMARVGGTHVPLMIANGGAALVRATRSGSSWSFDAYTTGLPEPRDFDLTQEWDMAYIKDRAGLQLMLYDPQGAQRTSLLFPFRASGAVLDTPVRVPTQLDVGDKPARCGGTTRTDTPRVVAPHQGGTRHPVIVTDTSEPMRVLLTDSAVLHGTPDEPCVAAFDAEIVPIDTSGGAAAGGFGYGYGTPPPAPTAPEREQAVILLDDLEHSWIFKHAPQPNGKTRIEYRLMSCRFDPGIDVPPEVYEAEGTLVRRTR